LLGLDFLSAKECQVNLKNNISEVQGEIIQAFLKKNSAGQEFQVSLVRPFHSIKVPPYSMHVTTVRLTEPMHRKCVYIIEPKFEKSHPGLELTTVCVQGNSLVPIELVNRTNHCIKVKPTEIIGIATELWEVLASGQEPEAKLEQSDFRSSINCCNVPTVSNKDGICISTDSQGNLDPELVCSRTSSENLVNERIMINTREEFRRRSEYSLLGTHEDVNVQGENEGPAVRSINDPIPHLDISEDTNWKSRLKEVCNKMPEHLVDLLNRTIPELSVDQAAEVGELLIEYQDCFAKHDLDLGCFQDIKHHIDTGDAPPVRQKIRRTPLGFQDEEKKHLQKLLDIGVIRPSISDWCSAPVLVRKSDGSVRWCVDFRAVNDLTVKDSFPIPNLRETLDVLAGNKYFTTLDLASGFYQVELDEESKKKTAFITKYGLFEHIRLGMGLCNSPRNFQRILQYVLKDLVFDVALVYIDDILCLGKDFKHHKSVLRQVLDRMRLHTLKLKPKKCTLFRTELEFLGKTVTQEGVKIAPAKIKVIQDWPVPTNVKQVESFLGYMNYHRDHVDGYAEVSRCLYELTGPKAKFEWKEGHQKAFEQMKSLLLSAPYLAYPIPDGDFILDVDASDKCVGAELSQIQDGEIKLISFASKVLTPAHRKYCTTRKELLAIVVFSRHFRHYLLGRRFKLRTDHNCLTWLMRFKHIKGQLARWLEELAV
jgi:hypothetical protein